MKVCIDPGHGMSNRRRNVFDPGATHTEEGERFAEATIVLRYGLTLKDILHVRHHDVFMTRDDEADHAPVGERALNAKRAGCDVFVSLHLNDAEDDRAQGLEVLFRDEADRTLAQALQEALVRVTNFRNRGIKQREDLAVLRFDGPAVLIELGFIANDNNRQALLNPHMRTAICEAIADTLGAQFAAANRPVTRHPIPDQPAMGPNPAPGYAVPAYARSIPGFDKIPWATATRITGMNVYEGLVRNSFHVFDSGVVFYESKFAIDGDGSGSNDEEDPHFQNDTSLHDTNNHALNSRRFPFIVLPLPPSDTGTARPQQFGIDLGDIGIVFFKNGRSCGVIYGDLGPKRRIGEGSMFAAQALGINADPNIGGIDATEIPPGIIHIVFPGTRDRNDKRTARTPEQIEQDAMALLQQFVGDRA